MKTLKKFEFKTASASSKYPWDAILDGKINVITKGEDYEVETDAMPPKIKTAARRRYKTVKVAIMTDDDGKKTDTIAVQATDMTPDQRIAEDAKRAEEKAKRKADGEAEEQVGDETPA